MRISKRKITIKIKGLVKKVLLFSLVTGGAVLAIAQPANAQILTGYSQDYPDMPEDSNVTPQAEATPTPQPAVGEQGGFLTRHYAALPSDESGQSASPSNAVDTSAAETDAPLENPAPWPVYQPKIASSAYAAQPVSVSSVAAQPSQKRSLRSAPFSVFNGGVMNGGAKEENGDDQPVDLQADSLSHDEEKQIITASGQVMMEQDGHILRADKVEYFLAEDKVIASGNVVLNEPNGDIHVVDRLELKNKMKDGFVQKLKSYLADGSRFTAREGTRSGGYKTVMRSASYTPCKPCAEHPEKAPVWQIKASKVTHNQEEHTISYNNARFEWFGVPVAYLPYFSHPDGTVKRKSGFLTPTAGYKSAVGAFGYERYYWSIDPHMDMTAGLMVMSDQDPLGTLEWRQRFEKGEIKLNGSATNSDRTENVGGQDVYHDAEWRGHLFGKGQYDFNEKWRGGFNMHLASDKQYLRQYDFSSDDVLENELYAERFFGRDYFSARLLGFQDVRVDDVARTPQPNVLPELEMSSFGEPGAVPLIGGRWGLHASFLGLQRNDEEQDMNRVRLDGSWYRRLVSRYGLLMTLKTTLRGDAYNVRDLASATPGSGESRNIWETRSFADAHTELSYPLIKPVDSGHWLLEPVTALTFATKVDRDGSKIPNEDSTDVQIDALNILKDNRFPGSDRIDDRSRVTYGMRSGWYGREGSYVRTFLGQSYNFSEKNNPFPSGSGLDGQYSDVVGQVMMDYKSMYSLDYRFQLDHDDFNSQRHELRAGLSYKQLSLSSSYLYARALEGTDITQSREQIENSLGYYLTDEWHVGLSSRHDLGEGGGLREATASLDYLGDCVSWSILGQRRITADTTGESSSEIIFRIGLKNLGEFQTGGISLGSSGGSSDTEDDTATSASSF